MSRTGADLDELPKRALQEPDDPRSKKQKDVKPDGRQRRPSADPNYRQCQFLVVRKNRFCRQRANKDCDYCGEHLLVSDQRDGSHGRIPCPLDPSHSCYAHLLDAHLKKCNARKKALPDYLVEGINGADCDLPREKFNVHSLNDEELQSFIERIKTLHHEHVTKPVDFDGCHVLLSDELGKFKDCTMVHKHLSQQGALLKIMDEKNLLKADQMFVEFGAGRGQLATWVMQSLGDEGVAKSSFVLIDRGSQRYKADNRFVDKWGSSIHRIRADIRHLCLERVPSFENHGGKVFGFCKHLCGVAIDLALRCITDTLGAGRLPQGLVMAVCCHHRCEWHWYSGKDWLETFGFTEKDFQVMVSIAGWATCGSGSRGSKQRLDQEKAEKGAEVSDGTAEREASRESSLEPKTDRQTSPQVMVQETGGEEHQDVQPYTQKANRYQTMGLSAERRKQIGFMVKAILDEGRLRYLRSRGLKANRYKFIDEKYTPENFAIVATK